LVAEFLGEFHELVLLFFLDVAVGLESDFFFVGLATGDHAVDDARDFVRRGGDAGGFAESAFHAPTVFSHFALGFFQAKGGESQRFSDVVFDFTGFAAQQLASTDGVAGAES